MSLLHLTWLNNSKCMLPGHLVAIHLAGFYEDAACLCIKIAVLVQYIRSLLSRPGMRTMLLLVTVPESESLL